MTVDGNVLQGQQILVVDDEPDNLEVVVVLLQMYDVDVLIGSNGQEGLELAREFQPRFVISDLSMPVMSGWEMIHILKNDPKTKDIPVIALTAHAMTGDKQRALAAGFHNYLSKPLQPATFIQDFLQLVMNTPAMAELLSSEKG
ncbi:MAG: response regulator [Anaerolineaceae bacterium]|nr:response regulator [Anaerolineaceae bacterium]